MSRRRGCRRPRPTGSGRPRPPALVGLFLPLVLLAVGCTAQPPSTDAHVVTPPPFDECTALTTAPTGAPVAAPTAPSGPAAAEVTPPAGASSAGPAGAAGSTPTSLPEAELPCFTGGQLIPLHRVRGPAVVNLWASWCQPCRKELPAFQRLADRVGDQMHVIGVDTRDSREDARSLAEHLDVTYPNLFDPDEKLRRALGRPYTPMTLFVDSEGRVRHLDVSGALDDTALARLVQQHLGVVVP